MPRSELSRPHQVIEWLDDWGARLNEEAEMILIGSGGLLWHVHAAGMDTPVIVPSVDDLLTPKLQRNEPRDRAQAAWMRSLGLTGGEAPA